MATMTVQTAATTHVGVNSRVASSSAPPPPLILSLSLSLSAVLSFTVAAVPALQRNASLCLVAPPLPIRVLQLYHTRFAFRFTFPCHSCTHPNPTPPHSLFHKLYTLLRSLPCSPFYFFLPKIFVLHIYSFLILVENGFYLIF